MVENIGDLILGGIRKNRDRHTAEWHKGKHGHCPVGHVLGKDCHPVPGPYPVSRKAGRKFVAFLLEFPVGITHVGTYHLRELIVLIHGCGIFVQLSEGVDITLPQLHHLLMEIIHVLSFNCIPAGRHMMQFMFLPRI